MYCVLREKIMLLTDAVAKKDITETKKQTGSWANNLSLKDVAFKAIHVIPRLLP